MCKNLSCLADKYLLIKAEEAFSYLRNEFDDLIDDSLLNLIDSLTEGEERLPTSHAMDVVAGLRMKMPRSQEDKKIKNDGVILRD